MTVLRPTSVLILLSVALAASAAPATYTLSGVGSGSLDGTAFTNSSFTLVATGDTSAIFSGGSGLVDLTAVTNTVSIAPAIGIISDRITDAMTVADNQNYGRAGFGDAAQDYAILFVDNAAFSTYGLASSIGPLSGSTIFNGGNAFPTSRGTFVLNSVSSASFAASVQATPEPSALAALGLGGLAVLRRRKRA